MNDYNQTCMGCRDGILNQEAHYSYGGCLYDENDKYDGFYSLNDIMTNNVEYKINNTKTVQNKQKINKNPNIKTVSKQYQINQKLMKTAPKQHKISTNTVQSDGNMENDENNGIITTTNNKNKQITKLKQLRELQAKLQQLTIKKDQITEEINQVILLMNIIKKQQKKNG